MPSFLPFSQCFVQHIARGSVNLDVMYREIFLSGFWHPRISGTRRTRESARRDLIESAKERICIKGTFFFFCCRCGFGHGRGGGRRPHSESTSGSGRQRCVCHMRRSRDRKALRRRVLRRLQGLLPAIRQKESSVHVQVHMSFPRRDKYIIQNILLSH